MKKLLLIAAVAVFGFTSVNAQEVSFGAKAGLNFASVGGGDEENFPKNTGKTAFNVGAVAKIGISEKFAVQPELVYSSQGFKFSTGLADDDANAKLDYINIPVLADFTVGSGFSLQAGPQVGFVITHKIDVDNVGETELDDVGTDFSIALGAQYELDSGLFFQARYTLGMADITPDVDIQNNVISFSVGYFFL